MADMLSHFPGQAGVENRSDLAKKESREGGTDTDIREVCTLGISSFTMSPA